MRKHQNGAATVLAHVAAESLFRSCWRREIRLLLHVYLLNSTLFLDFVAESSRKRDSGSRGGRCHKYRRIYKHLDFAWQTTRFQW